MRSIRLSLLVYFLLLMGAALGGASLLVYETTRKSLDERHRTMAQVLHDEHQSKLDHTLLQETMDLLGFPKDQAKRPTKGFPKKLANQTPQVEVQISWNNRNPKALGAHGVGALSAALAPNGHLTIPLWVNQAAVYYQPVFLGRPFPKETPKSLNALGILAAPPGPNSHLTTTLWGYEAWHAQTVFSLSKPAPPGAWTSGWMRDLLQTMQARVTLEGIRTPTPDHHLTDYFQVHYGHRLVKQSDSLRARHLPFDPTKLADDTVLAWRYDDSDLNGTPVRVATVRLRPGLFQVKRDPNMKTGPGFPAGITYWLSILEYLNQPLYIQCAYDKTKADTLVTQAEDDLKAKLTQLDQSTAAALDSLSQSLLLVGLITFGLTLVGGVTLVGLGVRPLHKFSVAVSKVSPRDFRLPLETRRVPNELRPIAERLQETFEMVRRAFAREKQATADISHELRTPLAALLTTLDVALRKNRSVEEYQEVLRDCRSSGQHMYALVERLLALARLDAGVDQLRTREVDVAQLAEQCATMIRPLAEARGVSINVHKDGPAEMRADPDKLREVVTNLLHNAIEYNKPNGAIDLEVCRDNGDVRVEVRDTGIGISAEARLHIFERFYRSDPSRQADGLHAGLGLAIVKGYIELMGGKIDVESVQGEGSTFRIRLPMHAAGA